MSAEPIRILLVSPNFYPATAWGGPVHSMLGLCTALAARGDTQVRVLTTDAAGPTSPDSIREAACRWTPPPNLDVFYARRLAMQSLSSELLRKLPAAIRWADVVYLNYAYSFPIMPTLGIAGALGKPVLWAPRGNLQRWGGTRYKYVRPVWEFLCNQIARRGRVVLHVTSPEESAESLERLTRLKAAIVPHGVDIPVAGKVWTERAPGAPLNLVYLGRLDVKKGIENLIDALAEVRRALPLTLTVCGAGEVGYAASLRARVAERGLAEAVRFLGHVAGESKTAALIAADASIMPSYTENFGMVAAEAMAHGLPVIASKYTPWSALETEHCGLWVDNSPASLADAIIRLSAMDLAAMGQRARAWMARDFSWEHRAAQMRALFVGMI